MDTLNHQIYTARWIFPVDAPPIERGCITIANDKIAALESRGARTPDVDLGDVAILPGFVNAHTHLDLTGSRSLCPPTPEFTQWLRQVIAFRRTRSPEHVQADIAEGIAECLRFGTTLIGDISSGGESWISLANCPCRSVVFHEMLGLTKERAQQSWQLARQWLEATKSDECHRAGLSPHAPYSVLSTQYSVLGTQPYLIATHLGESEDELQLLRHHTGPFVDFLKKMNVWNEEGLIQSCEQVVRELPHGIFVHCNYLDPATPFLATQTVVVCPRTHAAFGHPHHPFLTSQSGRGAGGEGVRVALGTDSLASNPDLDILAEARFLRLHYPEVAPAAILRMLTLNGAEALGFADVTGSLTPGKSADLVVLPLPNEERDDPNDLVLASTLPVRDVMFRGNWVRSP